jgi:hypothetical protein
MPLALHDFLLRVAVLPELTVARAAAVSGDARAAERFDEIERRGLFATVLDADERTLVLHDLFREALLDRLRRRWPEQEAAAAAPRRRQRDRPRAPRRLPAARAGLAGRRSRAGRRPRRPAAGRWHARAAAPGRRLRRRLARAFTAPAAPGRHGLHLRWDWEPMARHMKAAADAARRLGDQAELDLAEAYLAGALYPLDQNAEGEALIAALLARPTGADARRLALMADCSSACAAANGPPAPGLRRGAGPAGHAARALCLVGMCAALQLDHGARPAAADRPLRQRRAGCAWAAGRCPCAPTCGCCGCSALLWQGRMVDEAFEADAVAESDQRWLACTGELELGLAIYRLIDAALPRPGRRGAGADAVAVPARGRCRRRPAAPVAPPHGHLRRAHGRHPGRGRPRGTHRTLGHAPEGRPAAQRALEQPPRHRRARAPRRRAGPLGRRRRRFCPAAAAAAAAGRDGPCAGPAAARRARAAAGRAARRGRRRVGAGAAACA